MAHPFDVHAFVGRSFGSVLDEITSWSGNLGFTETGPNDVRAMIAGPIAEGDRRADGEIRRKLAPVLTALRDGTVGLADVTGAVVARRVWLSGRWTFYRNDERQIEWLEATTETGRQAEYFSPGFIGPKPVPNGKRARGNTGYDDAAVVKLARSIYAAMLKRSKLGAAEVAVDQLIEAGKPIAGTSRAAWVKRIRQDI